MCERKTGKQAYKEAETSLYGTELAAMTWIDCIVELHLSAASIDKSVNQSINQTATSNLPPTPLSLSLSLGSD